MSHVANGMTITKLRAERRLAQQLYRGRYILQFLVYAMFESQFRHKQRRLLRVVSILDFSWGTVTLSVCSRYHYINDARKLEL